MAQNILKSIVLFFSFEVCTVQCLRAGAGIRAVLEGDGARKKSIGSQSR